MIIHSALDKSIFEENGVFTENSRRKFCENTDQTFQKMKEVKPMVFAGICSLKGRINELLQEHREASYKKIVGLTGTEEYKAISSHNYELQCFVTAAKIYQMELGDEKTIFDSIDYTEHFQEIYQQMIFYFRRIQLKLSKPLQKECLTYARSKGLSIYAVTQILVDCNIGGVPQIAVSLADLYMEQGYIKEALFLTAFTAEHVENEKRTLLEEKKDEIMRECF